MNSGASTAAAVFLSHQQPLPTRIDTPFNKKGAVNWRKQIRINACSVICAASSSMIVANAALDVGALSLSLFAPNVEHLYEQGV